MSDILQQLKHGLIASVQADEGEPLNHPFILAAMAQSCLAGGAVGVRMANPENIETFKSTCPNIPVIAITKPHAIPSNATEIVYITPTFEDVAILAEAGADIVAMDATLRPRPNGETLDQIVSQARMEFPDLLLMADCATVEEGFHAANLGFDLLSTTLSGYTQETLNKPNAPDYEMLSTLVKEAAIPVILEGKVWQLEEVKKAFDLGAFAVVVGSAITRPHHITKRFVAAIPTVGSTSRSTTL